MASSWPDTLGLTQGSQRYLLQAVKAFIQVLHTYLQCIILTILTLLKYLISSSYNRLYARDSPCLHTTTIPPFPHGALNHAGSDGGGETIPSTRSHFSVSPTGGPAPPPLKSQVCRILITDITRAYLLSFYSAPTIERNYYCIIELLTQ